MGNATKVAAVAVGDLHLSFGRDRILILRNYLFVPSIKRNLVTVSSLVKNGYTVYFNKRVVIKENKRFICSGQLVDNLHIINPVSPTLQLNELNNTNSLPFKRKEPSKANQMLL